MSDSAKVTPFDPQKKGTEMSIDVFEITARNKSFPVAFSEVGDFELGPAGRVSTFDNLASPEWTLYSVDATARHAVLVELPEGTDLSQASFVYSQQYAEARRAALMPFDTFIAAASDIVPPAGLTFLFSTGRCGSTLASRILAQLPEVWSLSEPDYLTNIAVARMELGLGESAELVRAATLWTCRPPTGRSFETVVIKPRSEAVTPAPGGA